MKHLPAHQLATRVADQATPVQRQALLRWLKGLLQLRHSPLPARQKALHALALTARGRVLWPLIKLLAAEFNRLGWDERGTPGRAGLAVAAGAAAVLGGQGAGIAALGSAVGVPLWVVLGAGAYVAAGLVQELQARQPQGVQDESGPQGRGEVIDVQAFEVRHDR